MDNDKLSMHCIHTGYYTCKCIPIRKILHTHQRTLPTTGKIHWDVFLPEHIGKTCKVYLCDSIQTHICIEITNENNCAKVLPNGILNLKNILLPQAIEIRKILRSPVSSRYTWYLKVTTIENDEAIACSKWFKLKSRRTRLSDEIGDESNLKKQNQMDINFIMH